MANTPMFTRSPHIISVTSDNFATIKLELFIHSAFASIPSLPTETLSKPIPTVGFSAVEFNISPFIRRFITHLSFGEVFTGEDPADLGEFAFCTTKSYINDVLQTTLTFICFDGYGYFEDGRNPFPLAPFLTEGSYVINETGGTGAVYVFNDLTGPVWNAKYTGLKTGTIINQTLTNELGRVPYVPTSLVNEGAKLEITKDAVVQKTYIFNSECESKYEVFKCDFVNRFGMWQRLTFFKVNRVEITTKAENFNLMPDDSDYNILQDVDQTFNTNGRESIRLNTGFVPEDYGEVIKELALSEKIMINDRPVKLRRRNFELFTHINNHNINYEVQFEYTHDLINNII